MNKEFTKWLDYYKNNPLINSLIDSYLIYLMEFYDETAHLYYTIEKELHWEK